MTLTASDLHYAYEPRRWAVRELEMEVRAGEVLGIIGPNGSGKSTLMRLLSGMLRPARGDVRLEGRPLRAFSPSALARRIAFLPQAVFPAFAFSCEEVVAQGRYAHLGAFGFLSREDEATVRRCMAQTDTAEFTRRTLGEISGGERQRVLIASILAQEADHLLLDEPTAALDIHHQANVFRLLWRASRDRMAVAVIVHDLNLAAQFCDRLVLMSAGRKTAEGSPREVLRYENLAPVYGGAVAVGENTLTGGPLVTVLLERTESADMLG